MVSRFTFTGREFCTGPGVGQGQKLMFTHVSNHVELAGAERQDEKSDMPFKCHARAPVGNHAGK
jgi:hypothetical protein